MPLEDGALAFLARLPLAQDGAHIMAQLIAHTHWRCETITVWGKRHPQPRLTAWMGDAAYRYSGITLAPAPFSPLVQTLRQAVEAASGQRFNSVLLNYYRDGRDSMGMHSDDEPELGARPVIASLSFGATRSFVLKHKTSGRTVKIDLGDGNLLIMFEETQKNWLHGIPKLSRPCGPRLNLTFRNIIE